MLSARAHGVGEPVAFFLHHLGGSGREWTGVVDCLAGQLRCVTIDLPGFGDSAEEVGYTVEEMTEAVTAVIQAETRGAWMLAGHSMGAKVAAVVARCAEDGANGLSGLRGLVMLAGSPPSPEPMMESRRQKMLTWFAGDSERCRREAKEYLRLNLGTALDGEMWDASVEDVLRMRREAWLAWLERGSREDWSKRVGLLRTPALVLAGEKDPDLGPGGQRSKMMPHFATARMEVLAGAKHLLPMERTAEVEGAIAEFAAEVLAPGEPEIRTRGGGR